MGVQNSENNPFSVEVVKSPAAPDTAASAGSGGDDMWVWSQSTEVKFDTLSVTPPGIRTNESSYSIFTETGLLMRPTHAHFNERVSKSPASTPAETEDGSSGADMALWSLGTRERYRSLSFKPQSAYFNESQYNIFQKDGIFMEPSRADFGTRVDTTPEATSGEPEDGTLGSDMELWSLSTEDRYDRLSFQHQSNYLNEASYSIYQESGLILDPSRATWSTQITESPSQPKSESLSGSGGGEMSMWSSTVEVRYSRVSNQPLTELTNESAYKVLEGQSAIMQPSRGPDWQTRADMSPGVSASATAKGEDGQYISGTAGLLNNDGDAVASASVTGSFTVVGPPAPGISSGENNTDNPVYDLVFSPSSGPDALEEDATEKTGIEFIYTTVSGKVLDSQGAPVPDDTIMSDVGSVRTDANGEYTLVAPGGITIEMQGLNGSSSRNIDASKVDTVDWQYCGVTISVYNPEDGSPIEGAPVAIGGQSYTTDSAGEVTVSMLGLDSYTAVVFNDYTSAVSFDFEGQHKTIEFGTDSSDFDGEDQDLTATGVQVVDYNTGRPVKDISLVNRDTGTRITTGEMGLAEMIDSSGGGELEITVGLDDPRYKAKTVTATELEELGGEIPLEARTPTVNM